MKHILWLRHWGNNGCLVIEVCLSPHVMELVRGAGSKRRGGQQDEPNVFKVIHVNLVVVLYEIEF